MIDLKEGEWVAVITKDGKKGVGCVIDGYDGADHVILVHIIFGNGAEKLMLPSEMKAIAKLEIDWGEHNERPRH